MNKRFPKVVKSRVKSKWVAKEADLPIFGELALSGFGQRLIKQDPLIIKNFLLAARKVSSLAINKCIIGSVEVERVRTTGSSATSYYKVSIKGKSFFVKEFVFKKTGTHFNPTKDLPLFQRVSITKLREYLKAHQKDFPNFTIANFHLAFTGRERAFLVSDYFDLVAPDFASNPLIFQKLSQLSKSSGVADLLGNTLYSPSKKKYVIIDPRS